MMDIRLVLTTGLFWDIDPVSLDPAKDAGFIITRVLTRGTLEDWNRIKAFYGLETIRQASLQARFLDKKTLAFCSAIFSVPKNNFRCYTFSQLIPEVWNS